MKICARHRHNLGKFWRPSTACLYPKHEGGPGRKTSKTRYSVSLDMSQKIQRIFGIFVPVGSGRKSITNLIVQFNFNQMQLFYFKCHDLWADPVALIKITTLTFAFLNYLVLCNNCRNRHNAIVKELTSISCDVSTPQGDVVTRTITARYGINIFSLFYYSNITNIVMMIK